MEKEAKYNIKLLILVIILCAIIFTPLGFFLAKGTAINETSNEIIDNGDHPLDTISEKEVKELISKYYEPIRSIFDGTFGNKEKTIIALRDYRVNQEYISCDDISGVDKEITYNNTTYYCDGRVKSYNDVLAVAHNLFGNNVEVLKENVADEYLLFNYNSNINKYVIFTSTSNIGEVVIGSEAVFNRYYTEGNKLIALVDIAEKSYTFEFVKSNDSYVLNNIH